MEVCAVEVPVAVVGANADVEGSLADISFADGSPPALSISLAAAAKVVALVAAVLDARVASEH